MTISSGYVTYSSTSVPEVDSIPTWEQNGVNGKYSLAQTPVIIDRVTGAMSGNSIKPLNVTTNTYTLDSTNISQQIYFSFAGAVTVTIADSTSLNVGDFWLYAAQAGTTLTLSLAGGGDSILGVTSIAATESGTILLRTALIFENDPRFQAGVPGVGTVTSVGLTSVNADITVTGATPITGAGAWSLTLASVGGASAANVATATALALAATDANTVSAIVKRDGAGAIAVGATTVNGNLTFGALGNKMIVPTGANASAGQNTLVAGTLTLNTTAITANSLVQLTRAGPGSTGAAALGSLTVGTITPGVSFVINALQVADSSAIQATDISVVNWAIVN